MPTLILPYGDGYESVPLLTTMNLYEHEFIIVVPAELRMEMQPNVVLTGEDSQGSRIAIGGACKMGRTWSHTSRVRP